MGRAHGTHSWDALLGRALPRVPHGHAVTGSRARELRICDQYLQQVITIALAVPTDQVVRWI